MYPQGLGQSGQCNAPMMIQPSQPPQSGIASAIQELRTAISQSRQLSYSVKSALGLGSPPENEKTPPVSSLCGVLIEMRIDVAKANADLEEAITHLNS